MLVKLLQYYYIFAIYIKEGILTECTATFKKVCQWKMMFSI